MKKVFFLILWSALFFTTLPLLAQESLSSSKKYSGVDEQLVYNVIKRIFFSSEHKSIIETSWSALHVSKRDTSGYLNIKIVEDDIVLTTKYLDMSEEKEMTLEIFSLVDDEKSYLNGDAFLHKLLWNRVEYALGIQEKWINCMFTIQALPYINHPLCKNTKEKILP